MDTEREITFQDILAAKADGDLERLNEASLGRAYQHVQKQGHDSFAILTAHRSDASPKQNRENMKALKGELKSLGHGHIRLQGHWEGSKEPSLMVPGLSRDHAVRLGKKYNQDAVIHKGPESDHKVHLITKDGETHDLGQFHPQKIAQGYSSLRGGKHSFTFEMVADSMAEALIERVFWIRHERVRP